MAIGEPQTRGYRLFWLFCTERLGAKAQVHYLSRPEIARVFHGDAHYADMQVNISGRRDLGLRLSVFLVDKDGESIKWQFDPGGGILGPGGLTDQSGHARDQFLLWFHRRYGLRSDDSIVHYAGESVGGVGGRPDDSFVAAYSRDIYIASVPVWALCNQGDTGDHGPWDIVLRDV